MLDFNNNLFNKDNFQTMSNKMSNATIATDSNFVTIKIA